MTDWTLTKIKMQSGVWQGLITGASEEPQITLLHLDRKVDGVMLSPGKDEGTWVLQIAIPSEAIADGVQTLLITDARTDTVKEQITLIGGEALGDDLRAEVDLLRAELDMLKRTFRRHCLETA